LEAAAAGDGPVTEATLGFLIAPRLNAAGRMGKADDAFRLLVEDDPQMAAYLARALDENNQARRNEEQRIFTECLALAPTGGEDSFQEAVTHCNGGVYLVCLVKVKNVQFVFKGSVVQGKYFVFFKRGHGAIFPTSGKAKA
ncbi:MAG: hypothetical protein IIT45_00640, partial [Treponema sp.]|nr:hypothetical protein [Treponema sp.]